YQLLKNLLLFKNLDTPILAGVSRKSMLYKPLNITPKMALNATTSANTIALLNGATILRVHDVKEAVEAIKIVEQLS
ncbi:MAG: dihydropteroate synthase, partial [Polaribacter sp.]|nr:dihydropteroate synthase [Polaribacter sp.]